MTVLPGFRDLLEQRRFRTEAIAFLPLVLKSIMAQKHRLNLIIPELAEILHWQI